MENWQKHRNYRRFTDKDGNVVNVIRVDGETVEVSDDVYKAYSQMDRHERYEMFEKASENIVFLDTSALETVCAKVGLFVPSAEDTCVEAELNSALHAALDALNPRDRDLIETVAYGEQSERDYARSIGKAQSTVRKRRLRILRDLKRMLETHGF